MLAASYSKRDHVLALTEMQARETGGQVSKKHAGTQKRCSATETRQQSVGVSRISSIEGNKGNAPNTKLF